MTRAVVFRPQAEREALGVLGWYEGRRAGLGEEFGAEVNVLVIRIAANLCSFRECVARSDAPSSLGSRMRCISG